MKTKSPEIEDLFRKAWESYKPNPSPKLLRKIRFTLWANDFFSLDFQKFNIIYTLLIAGGITSASIYLSSKNNGNEIILSENDSNLEEIAGNPFSGKIEEDISLKEYSISDETDVAHTLLWAHFIPSQHSGCAPFEVQFMNRTENAIKYIWDFGTGDKSNDKNPTYIFKQPGSYTITLIAINKDGQEEVFKEKISVYDRPVANLEIDKEESEIATREIVFNNKSKNGESYLWYFGDKTTSEEANPKHIYPEFKKYNVTLITTSFHGCTDTVTLTNRFIEKNYTLAFPWSFTPSSNGRSNQGYYERAGSESSIFYPKNSGALKYELSIYSPTGVKVFSSNNIKLGWNGYIKGRMAPSGVYTYTATGIYPNEKSFSLKGNVRVISSEGFQDNY